MRSFLFKTYSMKLSKVTKLLTAIATLLCTEGYGQISPEEKGLNVISKDASQAILTYLSSDWMEGREISSKGHANAADYLSSMFQLYGLQPIEKFYDPFAAIENMQYPKSRYFQNFGLLLLEKSNEQTLAITSKQGAASIVESFRFNTDFTTSDFIGHPFRSISITAPIVFVGYGLTDTKNGYDDYKGIDVKGKVVLRLRGYPGHNDTTSIGYKKFKVERSNPYQYMNFEFDKNRYALEHGAVGCLEVNTLNESLIYQASNIFRYNLGPYESDTNPENEVNFLKMIIPLKDTMEKALAGFTISQRVANALLAASNFSILHFENSVKKNLKPASFEIKEQQVNLATKACWQLIGCKNILGVIKGEDTTQVVVVGAHYDHIGKYKGIIYNGADDNASGVAALLEIAKACRATGIKPKHTIVFAAWDAEEEGMFGSRHFLKNPLFDKIIANVNFDMISRNPAKDAKGTYCKVTYTAPMEYLKSNTERFINQHGLNLQVEYETDSKPSIGTDSDSFAEKNIPVLSFETGRHPDYHKPSDEASKCNLTKMTDIIRLGFLSVWKIANK